MPNIYSLFEDWQHISKIIPLSKFCENGRMTEKQKNIFQHEVSMAKLLFKKEGAHVIELQIGNIYPRDRFIYGWVRAVFQTMPYEITIILNCRNKYFLLLKADTQSRTNNTAVFTDRIVTNIYSNGTWVNGERFDENDLVIRSEPIDWDLFPSTIRIINPNNSIEFTDDDGEIIKLPYPQRCNVSECEIDEYIAFAKKEYEFNLKDELAFLFGAELDDAFSDFWHQTEQRFRTRNDASIFGFPSQTEDDNMHNELFWGFVDEELIDDSAYVKYINDYKIFNER